MEIKLNILLLFGAFQSIICSNYYDLDSMYKVEPVYSRKRITQRPGKNEKKGDYKKDENEKESRFYYGGKYKGEFN